MGRVPFKQPQIAKNRYNRRDQQKIERVSKKLQLAWPQNGGCPLDISGSEYIIEIERYKKNYDNRCVFNKVMDYILNDKRI